MITPAPTARHLGFPIGMEQFWSLRNRVSGLPQRSESRPSLGLLEVKVIAAIHIDMLIAGRPDMGEITILNRIAFPFELVHDGRHIHGIPEDDRIRDQIEATGLMHQLLAPFAAQVPL